MSKEEYAAAKKRKSIDPAKLNDTCPECGAEYIGPGHECKARCPTCKGTKRIVRTFTGSIGLETPWRAKGSSMSREDEERPCPDCKPADAQMAKDCELQATVFTGVRYDDSVPRMRHIPGCNWFPGDCGCGAEAINAFIDRQAEEIKAKDAQSAKETEKEPDKVLSVNTTSMDKMARSVKDGRGTRVGSLALMLIDCCYIINCQAEQIKAKDKAIRGALDIKALWEPADNMTHICEGKALLKMAEQLKQALKEGD